MTDFDGGAQAPAEPSAVAIPSEAPPPNNPLPPQTPVAEKAPEPKTEPEKKPEAAKTPSDAIRRANEAVKAKAAEGDGKPAPKPDSKPDETGKPEPKAPQNPRPSEPEAQPRQRAQDGRFAPVEGKGAPEDERPPAPARNDAPARFSAEAKAAWEAAPEPVRNEVHRALREMEGGFEKHRADAEAYRTVKDFDDLAKQHGGNLRASLEKVKAIEDAFERNPLEGLQRVADHFGLNMRAVAAHIMGQTPDQVQQQQDGTIAELRREIAGMKQQLGGVSKTMDQQREERTHADVSKFAADNPRFEELADAIATEIQHGYSLSEAYDRAARLNPAPDTRPSPPPAPPAVTPARPLNPAGQKSITGAPSSGSDPIERRPQSSSSLEALQRASQRLRA